MKKHWIFVPLAVLVVLGGIYVCYDFFKPDPDLTIPADFHYQGRSYEQSLYLDWDTHSLEKVTKIGKLSQKSYLNLVKFPELPTKTTLGVENSNLGFMDQGSSAVYFSDKADNSLSRALALISPLKTDVETGGVNGKKLKDYSLSAKSTRILTDYLSAHENEGKRITDDPFATSTKSIYNLTISGKNAYGFNTSFAYGISDSGVPIIERTLGDENDPSDKSIVWENIPQNIQKIIEK
ncbi:hypothetical protein GHI93_08075 [Lactococcus hircilactis]|uniref:Uncharacterized protein n=1 Tax=Lactococcus hircilactis TaxID=1494462 RepID=A0A7X1Z8N5_9LACT|nr:hypothetical protein [Lactococcus hircilactis]MQW39881.1 hypothetical protein [Lactococcus hircilactis]